MMKIIILSLFALFFQLLLFAQEIPNNGFENWYVGEPVDWLTSNFPGYNLVSQSSDAHEGSSSAYMEVMGNITSSFIPVLQVSGPDSMVGIPITLRYTRFRGYYKFTRMGIDFFNIQLFMYSNNVLIGTGEAPRAPVTCWTEFEVPINYFTSDIPDMVNITFSISALGGGQGTIGSNGYVDNVMLGFIGTTLTMNATAGSQILEVASTNGFSIGDDILINPGEATEEANTIAGFGSMLLQTPLQFDHLSGEQVVLDVSTSVEENYDLVAGEYSLKQNYPNPFNPSTVIIWQSPVSGHQTLRVFDVLGNEVATFVDEDKPAGKYEVEFNASNLSSGIYFYRLQAGPFVETKKMILLR